MDAYIIDDRLNQYFNGSVSRIGQYVNRRTPIRVKCNICNYEWDFPVTNLMPSAMRKTSNHIGCPNCHKQKIHQELECAFCHKKIIRLNSEIKNNKTNKVFCSRECGNRYKNLEIINTLNGSAYRRNAFSVYPHRCKICGWDKDERVLEVHHIDENRNNNDISNLVILCPTCHKFFTLHIYDSSIL